MEKGLHDLAVDVLKERLYIAQDILKERYKGVVPFRQEKIPDREQLYQYETQGYEIFSQLAEEKGLPEAIKYRNSMEQLRGKYGR